MISRLALVAPHLDDPWVTQIAHVGLEIPYAALAVA
jgi:hypothetical protein